MATQYPLILASGQMKQLPTTDVADIGYPVQLVKNYLMNGDFRIHQRGASSYTAASEPIIDGWRLATNGTLGTRSTTQQSTTFGDTALPAGHRRFCRIDQTVAGSGQSSSQLIQRIEFADTFAGQTVTYSFYAKADSNRTLSVNLTQSFGTGGSPSSDVVSSSQNFGVTTSWTRFEFQFAVPSVSGKVLGSNPNDYVAVGINLPLNTTYTFDITCAQLEIGVTATAYDMLPQSPYRMMGARQIQSLGRALNGVAFSTTIIGGFWIPWLPMRAAPTATLSTTTPQFLFPDGSTATGSGSTVTLNAGNGGGLFKIDGFTGLTVGQPCSLASGSVLLDASL